MLRSISGQDTERLAAALAGLDRYQRATRPVRLVAGRAVATAGRARLLDYGGDGPVVVVVPSLINGPEVFDLLAEQSMLRWLATQRVRPLLVDWGEPSPAERGLSVADHVDRLLLPLLASAPGDYRLVGYCLGGTLALAAAARAERPPAALALLATPWRFSGYPADARRAVGDLWKRSRDVAGALGLWPAEVLQAGFWQLDPERTVDKFAALGRSEDPAALARFVAVEDWANGGPPLTAAAGEELATSLFGDDASGCGQWRVAGRSVDPTALACPVLEIVSLTDRIVPAAATPGVGRRLELAQGHVGMVVGSRAKELLWEPLADWLRTPG
jgi:polyhydroxyalkanoate synthase subunit PhaC